MPVRRTLVCVFALLCAAPAAAATRTPWATVNVCDTASHPNTIGIRGSMPITTTARPAAAELFMRFQVEYLANDGSWRALTAGGDSGFIDVGRARGRGTRQAGHSFTVTPPQAGTVYTLRGRVTFDWRAKNGAVVRRARKRTTAGHRSTAGADPAGFSAAECTISG